MAFFASLFNRVPSMGTIGDVSKTITKYLPVYLGVVVVEAAAFSMLGLSFIAEFALPVIAVTLPVFVAAAAMVTIDGGEA